MSDWQAWPVPVAAEFDPPRRRARAVLGNSLGTSTAVWDRQVPDLRRSFRLLRFELPGHGAAAAWPGPYTIARPGRRRARAAGLARRRARRVRGHLARRHDRDVAGGRTRRTGSPRSGWSARRPTCRPPTAGGTGPLRCGQSGMSSSLRAGDRPLVHRRLRRPRAGGRRIGAGDAGAGRPGRLRGLLRGHRGDGPARRAARDHRARRWCSPATADPATPPEHGAAIAARIAGARPARAAGRRAPGRDLVGAPR